MPTAANGPSSIYATPSRTERMPFPQSTPSPAHVHAYHRQLATSTASSTSSLAVPTSSTSPPSVSKDRPLTSASLLKLHANSRDPKVAALEQAITERNTLSSQNAQLWKLIEKQRAGYNQILKELERVRGERDAFKAKIGLSGSNTTSGTSDRLHTSNDEDRPTNRTATDNAFARHTDGGSFDSENSNSNSRLPVARHNSDDHCGSNLPFCYVTLD